MKISQSCKEIAVEKVVCAVDAINLPREKLAFLIWSLPGCLDTMIAAADRDGDGDLRGIDAAFQELVNKTGALSKFR
ncbi:uncharacterized protein LODBEIA_P06240 [Lodderomyces beijingensis]|uniref:EF-hand domain-containing protein n=1 Tax=Lodderomyces beijingensis TaxID=1775926 RepID=A0ABP0ZDZ7_9ASCO